MLVNGVEICVDSVGDPADPAILLINGTGSSMDWWEDGFRDLLAAGRHVIRYDHRDTGQSVSYPPGEPGYTFDDLVDDAVGVLDALGVARAHIVGLSMGGAIAQCVALRSPDRVAALTLICTATVVATPSEEPAEEPTEQPAEQPAEASGPVWTDRNAVVEHLVADQRGLAARSRPFDEVAARQLAERVVDRTVNVESSARNHALAESDPARWPPSLAGITAPTLVMYGTEDPMLPRSFGVELAESISGARLIALERNGHELARENWPMITEEILAHG